MWKSACKTGVCVCVWVCACVCVRACVCGHACAHVGVGECTCVCTTSRSPSLHLASSWTYFRHTEMKVAHPSEVSKSVCGCDQCHNPLDCLWATCTIKAFLKPENLCCDSVRSSIIVHTWTKHSLVLCLTNIIISVGHVFTSIRIYFQVPLNTAVEGLCEGMLEAWKLYNNPKYV